MLVEDHILHDIGQQVIRLCLTNGQILGQEHPNVLSCVELILQDFTFFLLEELALSLLRDVHVPKHDIDYDFDEV